MKPFRLLGVSFLACFLHAALAQTPPPVDQPVAGAEGSSSELDEVSRLIKGGKHQDALGLVDIVIKSYEDRYRKGKAKAFSSRSRAEASAYLTEIGRGEGTAPEEAGVYSATWGDAYYLKGFILTDMKRLPEAREALQAAVALAPRNAAYRAELGQVLLKAKAYPEAVAQFKQAEADAREYSPPRVRNSELAAALRGQAFVLVEEKKLDDAEKLYRECLQLNSRDPVAQGELRYIAQLRQQPGPPAQPAKPAQ